LGLKEYYEKVVKNCGKITVPLTLLLKKEAISCTQEATESFEKLKEAMSSTLVSTT
jgi:hypothetical protein